MSGMRADARCEKRKVKAFREAAIGGILRARYAHTFAWGEYRDRKYEGRNGP
jgi:hypothetical protein